VDLALSSLAYSNHSDNPPASIEIDWVFSDGADTAQGTGGVQSVIGSTSVSITASNGAPLSANQTLSFNEGNTKNSQVDQLVQAMAGFAPPAMGQVDLSTVYAAQLAPVLAGSWH
jgi:hypothetical protein